MTQGRVRRTFTKEFQVEAVQLLQQPGMGVAKAAADPTARIERHRRSASNGAPNRNGRKGAETEPC